MLEIQPLPTFPAVLSGRNSPHGTCPTPLPSMDWLTAPPDQYAPAKPSTRCGCPRKFTDRQAHQEQVVSGLPKCLRRGDRASPVFAGSGKWAGGIVFTPDRQCLLPDDGGESPDLRIVFCLATKIGGTRRPGASIHAVFCRAMRKRCARAGRGKRSSLSCKWGRFCSIVRMRSGSAR